MNYPVQKALHYNEAKAKKNFQLGTYAIMEKRDGWLLYIDCIDGKWGKLSSRADREIPSVDYLNPIIANSITPIQDIRLIFEATIPNMQFHELNGVLNRKSEPAEEVVLNLHDVIFLNKPEIPFKERWEFVGFAYDKLRDTLKHQVALIPVLAVTSDEESIYKYFNDILENGGEGIILKNYDAGYFFGKRNSNLMKLKELITKDFAVVDLLPGEKGSKYEFTLGALVVQGRNGIKHTVSGMSDDERNLWWSNPDLIKGKVVQVNAMKELPDGSLREGRYKWVRHDKTLVEID